MARTGPWMIHGPVHVSWSFAVESARDAKLSKLDIVRHGKQNKPKALVLFEVAKGRMAGRQPDVQDIREVSGDELR